jgi:23S rRNA (uridine2552-2'-O)-methyltransferase
MRTVYAGCRMPRKDFYYNKAKVEGYRSRASFKLKQIDEAHDVIRKNDSIIDLGAAPGGWLQVAKELSGSGVVIGVDLQKIEPLEGVVTIRGDITNKNIKEKITPLIKDIKEKKNIKKDKIWEKSGPINVVLSDLAPNITGEYSLDHARSVHLCREAFGVALDLLCHGGNFIAKVFYGEDINKLLEDLNEQFETVKVFGPKASRKESSEVYVICKGRLTAPVKIGERIKVKIVEEGKRGDGVANIEGYTVFVPGAEIGDLVEIEIEEIRLRFGFAKICS